MILKLGREKRIKKAKKDIKKFNLRCPDDQMKTKKPPILK